ncbi:hypothetical protein COMA1_11100 [Candidatus Nitrospira nitrosa]|uniref:Uncharacterized protein n=1 Tax=Candidatus Nitrospira nitrosa TaxID=1742972 RepID=A0A0S4LBQ3_9BACT|nr:hypothetical protein COMA1_11100 [Candidatus Nitrospira nitrosa]
MTGCDIGVSDVCLAPVLCRRASTIPQMLSELHVATIAERSGRAQVQGRGIETLRKLGHI